MQKFLFLASQVQMLMIIISAQFFFVNDFDTDSLGSFLKDFSSSLCIFQPSDSNGNQMMLTAFLFFFIVYFFIFVITIIALIYYYIHKERVLWLENLYVYFAEIHYQVMFWTANMTLLNTLLIPSQTLSIGSSSINTRGGGFVFLVVILTILNYIIGVFSAYSRFDPFKTENIFSCWNPICQVSGFAFKAIVCPIVIWAPTGLTQSLMFFFVAIIILGNLAYKLLTIYPFFYFAAMSYGLLFSSAGIVISIVSIFTSLMYGNNQISSENLIYLELVLIPLAYTCQYSYLSNLVGLSLSEDIQKMRSAKEVFRNLFGLAHVLSKGKFTLSAGVLRLDDADELYVMSILRRHTKGCSTPTCICRYMLCRKNKSMPNFDEIKQRYSDLTFELIYELFCGAAKKVNDNIWIQLNLAYLELNRNDCGRNALLTLFEISKEKTSFQQLVALKKLLIQVKEKIDHFYQLQENGVLNIKQFVDYQQTTNHLKELIARNTDDYMRFWTYFKESELSTKILFDYSKEIETKSGEIEETWTNFNESHPKFCFSSYPYYASYLALTRNSVTRAEKLMVQYKKSLSYNFLLENEIVTQDNVHDSKNVIFYVSMKEETLGLILEASQSIESLGYSATELIGRNIGTIMPSCYQVHHQKALKDHLNSRTTLSKINQNMRVFVRSKNGSILPFNLYISICPAFENEVIYIGILRPIISDSDFMLLSPEGAVESFSKRLILKHNYKNDQLTSLNDLFKNSEQIIKTLKVVYGKASTLSSTSANAAKNFNRSDFSQQKTKSESSERRIPDSVSFNLIPRETSLKSLTGILTIQVLAENLIPVLEVSPTVAPIERKKSFDQSEMTNKSKVPSKMEDESDDTGSDVPNEDGKEPNKPLDAKNPVIIHLESAEKFETDSKSVTNDFEKHVIQAKAESSLHSSTASRRSLQRKIEGAVFYLPKILILSRLKLAMGLFLAEIVIILAVYLSQAASQYQMVSNDINLMLSMTAQINKMIEIDTNTRKLLILQEGLIEIPPGSTYEELQNLLITTLFQGGQTLSALNSEIRISLGGVDPSFFSQLYARSISLVDPGTHITIEETAFDYTTSVSSSIARIVDAQNEISATNTDIMFILDNTFNEYIVSADMIAQIMVLDAQTKLNAVGNILLAGMIACAASIFIITAGVIKYQMKFVREREKFIDALIRADERMIEEHLKFVRHLNIGTKKAITSRSSTTKSNISGNFAKIKVSSIKGVQKAKNRFRKNVIPDGINANLLFQFLALILTLSFYLVAFILLYILYGSSSSLDALILKIQNALQVGTSYVDFRIMYGSLQEYISLNETTSIRNFPISQEWDILYEEASTFQADLMTLLENSASSSNPALLQELLQGNLCTFFTNQSTYSSCYGIMGGMMTRGILGMNSEITAAAKEVKESFDTSARQETNMIEALNSEVYLNIQTVDSNWISQIYSQFSNLLKENAQSALNGFQLTSQYIVIAFFFGFALGLLIFWKTVMRPIENERNDWRKMIRIVPHRVILINNHLKTYLINNCEGYLDSFKKMLR